jgi:hypothetical protein
VQGCGPGHEPLRLVVDHREHDDRGVVVAHAHDTSVLDVDALERGVELPQRFDGGCGDDAWQRRRRDRAARQAADRRVVLALEQHLDEQAAAGDGGAQVDERDGRRRRGQRCLRLGRRQVRRERSRRRGGTHPDGLGLDLVELHHGDDPAIDLHAETGERDRLDVPDDLLRVPTGAGEHVDLERLVVLAADHPDGGDVRESSELAFQLLR